MNEKKRKEECSHSTLSFQFAIEVSFMIEDKGKAKSNVNRFEDIHGF
ncbi:hypothetical protein NV377_06000 [Paenibacillus sp. T3-5-0-4]|nr:hypothetical protein [Paenibacillus endoradicis]